MQGRARAAAVRLLVAMVALPAVAACDLPRGAAIQTEVIARADATDAGFAIYPVTRDALATYAAWPVPDDGRPRGWVARSRGPLSPVIAPGDRVTVTLWQSEDNSLLSAPAQKQVNLGQMTVSAAGTVFLPYVEEVRIAGMTPEAARRAVQQALSEIVPTGQVLLTLDSGRQNAVDVVAGARNPGVYPLADRDTTVLSILSAAGGVPPELRNPQLRLIRGSQVYGIPLARLYEAPALDTTLQGGDKIVVQADERHFIALGAAGQEQIVHFPKEELSVLDAAALIGGLNDARANPRGVLILRRYPATAVRPDPEGPRDAQVVFTVDLTSADGLFSAGIFRVLPGDVVLVTESPVTAAQTIFALIGSALRIGNQIAN